MSEGLTKVQKIKLFFGAGILTTAAACGAAPQQSLGGTSPEFTPEVTEVIGDNPNNSPTLTFQTDGTPIVTTLESPNLSYEERVSSAMMKYMMEHPETFNMALLPNSPCINYDPNFGVLVDSNIQGAYVAGQHAEQVSNPECGFEFTATALGFGLGLLQLRGSNDFSNDEEKLTEESGRKLEAYFKKELGSIRVLAHLSENYYNGINYKLIFESAGIPVQDHRGLVDFMADLFGAYTLDPVDQETLDIGTIQDAFAQFGIDAQAAFGDYIDVNTRPQWNPNDGEIPYNAYVATYASLGRISEKFFNNINLSAYDMYGESRFPNRPLLEVAP